MVAVNSHLQSLARSINPNGNQMITQQAMVSVNKREKDRETDVFVRDECAHWTKTTSL